MPARILLIQLRQLGDILLTTPAITALRRAYPDAQIDFLAHSMGRLILRDNPSINELLTYHEQDSWGQQYNLIRTLRRKRYDLLFDFMFNPRSAFLSWISRAEHRVSFESRRSWAYHHCVPKLQKTDYIVREKFTLLQSQGIACDDERLVLPFQKRDTEVWQKFRDSLDQTEQKRAWVVLSPTHRREARRWPLQRYQHLADRLQEDYGAVVIWAWGPGEKEFVQQVQQGTARPSYLMPETSFAELAAFFANCDLFIGNSNGPSHVAVSSGIPSLQLHGPTLARAWCPMNHEHRALQGQQMADISLEQVLEKLQSMWELVKKNSAVRLAKGVRIYENPDNGGEP